MWLFSLLPPFNAGVGIGAGGGNGVASYDFLFLSATRRVMLRVRSCGCSPCFSTRIFWSFRAKPCLLLRFFHVLCRFCVYNVHGHVFPLAAPTQFRYLLRYALGSCVFRLTVHVSGLLCGRVVVCRVLYRRGVLWPHFCLFYCCLVAAWLLLPEGVLCFSSSVFVGMGDAVSNGR